MGEPSLYYGIGGGRDRKMCNEELERKRKRERGRKNVLVIQNLNERSFSGKIQEREKRLTSSDRTYCLSSKKR